MRLDQIISTVKMLRAHVAKLDAELAHMEGELEKTLKRRDPLAVFLLQSRFEYRTALNGPDSRRYSAKREANGVVTRTFFEAKAMGYPGQLKEWAVFITTKFAPESEPPQV